MWGWDSCSCSPDMSLICSYCASRLAKLAIAGWVLSAIIAAGGGRRAVSYPGDLAFPNQPWRVRRFYFDRGGVLAGNPAHRPATAHRTF
jgi:hypothetical protein